MSFLILLGYYLGLAKFSSKSRGVLLCMALLSATLFHGAYDYFLFVQNVPGIWLGAFVSLGMGIYLSFRAIRIHIKNSPFGVSSQTDFLT
jgi:RsiW-degrading membrane proteinase PrsW (M82 family)